MNVEKVSARLVIDEGFVPYAYQRDDVAWAAGLFEGEGCISLSNKGGPAARLSVSMTDEDVIRRFHKVVRVGYVYKTALRNPRYKQQWCWSAHSHEACQFVIAMLWRWLGSRRRGRAHEVLKTYNGAPRRGWHHARKTHCKHGHEFSQQNTILRRYKDRWHRKCRVCQYESVRAWSKKNPERCREIKREWRDKQKRAQKV
jgi:hypothetical protein